MLWPLPAERAGVANADMVLHFAREAIRGFDDLHRLLISDHADTDEPSSLCEPDS